MKVKQQLYNFVHLIMKEHSARQIAASSVLGLFLAFAPIGSLHWIFCIVVMLLLRFNTVVTLASYLFFAPLAFGLARLSHRIGYWILVANPDLHRFLAWLFHAPILPYTQLNNTVVLGSLLISLTLAVPVFIVVTRLLNKHGKNLTLRLKYSRFWNTWSRYRLMPAEAVVTPEKLAKLRWKGLIPLFAFALFLVVYINFIFDRHLGSLLEIWATKVNRAPVEIASVKTHLLQGLIEVKGIAIANTGDPKTALLEIDKVQFKFRLNPLLRKKVIVDDMKVDGIHYGVVKKKGTNDAQEGESDTASPGLIERVASGIYDDVRKQLGDNPLRNIGMLMTGMDLSSKVGSSLKGLESAKKTAELKIKVKNLADDWRREFETLPLPRTLGETRAELTELIKAREKNPTSDLTEKIERIRQSMLNEQSRAGLVYQKFVNEAETLDREISEMSTLIDRDVLTLKDRLNLPRLEAKDLTPGLLGPLFLTQLEKLTYWVDLMRRRMPKGSRQGQIIAQENSRGNTINFGKMSAYPSFLLVQGNIHSDKSAGPNSGVGTGTVTGLTSDPPIFGQPCKFNLLMDFPDSKVSGIKVDATINHVGDSASEVIRVSADRIPLEGFAINDTGDLKLGISRGAVNFSAEAVYNENDLKAEMFASFRDVEFLSSSRFKKIEERVKEILQPVTTFTLSARVSGNMDSLKYSLTSNLGTRLAEGIYSEFKHQILAIEDDLRKNILDHIHPQVRVAVDQLDDLKKNIMVPAEFRLRALEELVASSDKKPRNLVSQQRRTPNRRPTSTKKQ